MKKKKQESPKPKSSNVPLIIGILAIAVLFTHKTIEGEELNYDDDRYITNNELIKDLNTRNVGEMFTTYFDGHYHPLTLLSLAVDAAVFKDPIKGHHVVNWLLHLANSVLVYLFLLALFKERWLSFGVALLFAVHPMNVESYAWMTERKNVLYSFFFLGAALAYLRYLTTKAWPVLGLCFLLFALSILSKAQAMMLLPVLFLVDWALKRDFREKKLYLEKLPFLLLVVGFVFLTSSAQVEEWGELNSSGYSRIEKFFLACTAFFQYFAKGIAPVDLSAYYPYPNDVGRDLQWYHFASPVFLAAFLAGAVVAFRKSKILFFGLALFFINIVMMLKFLDVPFGSYLMANRYNYLPLAGLMLVLVYGLFYLANRLSRSPQTRIALLLGIALAFGVMAYNRIKVWNNNTQLWTDIIENYPRYAHAYNSRGLGYIMEGNHAAAIQDFKATAELDPELEDPYMNLAVLHFQLGKELEALNYINQGKERFPNNPEVRRMSATINSKVKNYEVALKDIEKARELKPENERYKLTQAQIMVQSGKTEQAKEILQGLNDPKARQLLAALNNNSGGAATSASEKIDQLIDKGTALARQGKSREAISVYDQAIELAPDNVVAYLNRGSTYGQIGEPEKALRDFRKVLELDPQEPRAYFLMGMAYKDLDKKDLACENFENAGQRGWQLSEELRTYCAGR